MVDPSHKGKEFAPYSYTIEPGKVREFLLAVGEDNPVYRDSTLLPPTFSTLAAFWGGAGLEASLNEIDVEISRVLHSEQEYIYHAPVKVGDTITGTTRIADIYAREASAGSLEFIEFVTDYVNQDGDLVITDRSLVIVRE
ncbi:MAG: MaoC family dehydratase N-terminal domain-containing protein [Anaerolineae bacterium]|nr:MaoC family dehydratase N-terminal domain-containing protein [Anaerolineae bacterium]